MLKMLVDTCVWLDMAKTPSQSKNLEILSTLRAEEEVGVIVPRIVLDEFLRNRDRVIGEYVKSITTTLSRAKEIVVQQGGRKRTKALDTGIRTASTTRSLSRPTRTSSRKTISRGGASRS